jgi:hypothetical protein
MMGAFILSLVIVNRKWTLTGRSYFSCDSILRQVLGNPDRVECR